MISAGDAQFCLTSLAVHVRVEGFAGGVPLKECWGFESLKEKLQRQVRERCTHIPNGLVIAETRHSPVIR